MIFLNGMHFLCLPIFSVFFICYSIDHKDHLNHSPTSIVLPLLKQIAIARSFLETRSWLLEIFCLISLHDNLWVFRTTWLLFESPWNNVRGWLKLECVSPLIGTRQKLAQTYWMFTFLWKFVWHIDKKKSYLHRINCQKMRKLMKLFCITLLESNKIEKSFQNMWRTKVVKKTAHILGVKLHLLSWARGQALQQRNFC